jgi:WD40 repeat protein
MEHNFYTNYKEKIYALSACSFSPTSKLLAVGSVDSLIKIWDLRSDKNTQKEPLMIKSHMGGVTSLAWIKSLRGENYGP